MGSTASKPETKVFTPTAPVDFSASFLSHLESSQESDYTRAQYTEKYIQDRVAAEIQKLESNAINSFKKATNDAIAKDDGSKLSVASSNEKITQLTELLKENAKLLEIGLSDEIKSAQSAVVLCLKAHKGKPLSCWDEVTKFKELVNSM